MVWEGASLWMLEGNQAPAEIHAHSHHAIQITFLLHGAFDLTADGTSLSGPVAAVRSDTSHTFRAQGAVAFLFIEPESAAGCALAQQLFADRAITPLATPQAIHALEALRKCLEDGAEEPQMLTLGREIVRLLSTTAAPALPDPRVVRMIGYAAANLEDKVSLPSAAAHINLSEGRARHLFAMHTGLPFKTYVLWLRLDRAVQIYAGGRSLTDAAHQAGFADSAHFSRTFRRTFGLPAAALRLDGTARPS